VEGLRKRSTSPTLSTVSEGTEGAIPPSVDQGFSFRNIFDDDDFFDFGFFDEEEILLPRDKWVLLPLEATADESLLSMYDTAHVST